ncbi:trehalose transport system permease protein SugB [Spirochaetota bacterium]|nr:trehalose transport system permease protein SugB [Spirochaetota bacterium]
MTVREKILRVLFYATLGAIVVVSVFPFYYAIISSLKSGTDLFRVSYVPYPIDFSNYISVLNQGSFVRNVFNSLFVALLVVIISIGLAVGASYAIARIRFKGRGILMMLILSISMFPPIAVLPGMFQLITVLELSNSLISLLFSYMIFTIPFTVWVFNAFMREFPKELEHAALVDGASTATIIMRVFLPVLWPAVVSIGLLTFIAAWNEFLFALTFISSDPKRTAPVAIALLSGSTNHEIPWGNIMAASVIVTLPLVVLVLVFQRKIISGLAAGAIKG